MMIRDRIKFNKKFEWILVLLSFYIIFSLSRSMWELFGVSEKLDYVKKELAVEENKSVEIEAKIRQATSEAYIEEMARDRLNMQKEGERIVILQDDKDQFPGFDLEGDDRKEEEDPNWQKWWKLVN